MTDVGRTLKDSGKQANDSKWMDHLARAGLVAYGVVHLLIAWVAVQLAFGESGRQASSSGAFAELASKPFGTFALWALAIGLILLVLWRVLEAVVGHEDEEGADRWKKRAASGLKAALYAALAFSALKTLLSSNSGGKGRSMTGTVMSWPGGQWLVVLAGLAVIGYAGYTAYRGWSEKFLESLDSQGRTGEVGEAYKWFGKVGYLVKGISIGLVGGLIVHAGWTHSGKEDKGLDDALRTVLEQPFGPALLTAVAIGLACYGLFCFARARHLDR
ncbi:DUF1206 domain-containing protein [Nocardioides houyundeii]|uniref:DUF1206 domain-containing protein n=1 Tax=Nocardioides houyundeii TaxID=2045452 RepID=UPI000DF11FBD|nr:DUF1206 domain-containing protein [Nocardioides houyundeii]